ncbi:hypothetical protein ABPG74_019175 [Tetrahymena malaccensis]
MIQNKSKSLKNVEDLLQSFLSDITSIEIHFKRDSNNIESADILVLDQRIVKCISLQTSKFELQKINTNDIKVTNLISEIVKCVYIQSQLEGNQIGDLGAINLQIELAQFTSLQNLKLNLNQNIMNEVGVTNLTSEIFKCTQLQNLDIQLEKSQIGVLGALNLGIGLAKCTNLKILKLNLNRNSIQFYGALVLIKYLFQHSQLSSLQLDLQANQLYQKLNQITSCEIPDSTNYSNLSSLIFDLRCNFSSKKEVFELLSELPKSFTNLKSLKLLLGYCSIYEELALELGIILNQLLPNLITLDISFYFQTCYANAFYFNRFGDKGLFNLCNSLDKSCNIQTLVLDLRQTYIKEEGINSLILFLRKCKKLSTVTLDLYTPDDDIYWLDYIANNCLKFPRLVELQINHQNMWALHLDKIRHWYYQN